MDVSVFYETVAETYSFERFLMFVEVAFACCIYLPPPIKLAHFYLTGTHYVLSEQGK